jgi:hypothetical protein
LLDHALFGFQVRNVLLGFGFVVPVGLKSLLAGDLDQLALGVDPCSFLFKLLSLSLVFIDHMTKLFIETPELFPLLLYARKQLVNHVLRSWLAGNQNLRHLHHL